MIRNEQLTISDKVALLRDYYKDIPNVRVHNRNVWFGYYPIPTEVMFKTIFVNQMSPVSII